MINIAICDDEKIQRNILIEYLKTLSNETNRTYNIYEFNSGEELLDNYPAKLDIILLDIQMEKLTGMDVARKIREFDSKIEIIFTTAIWDYLQEGYEVKAYRYLMKPISYDNFKKNIGACIESLLKSDESCLVLQSKDSINRVLIDSILYIETDRRELIVHTTDDIFTIRMSMGKLEKMLSDRNFFRCHTSFLVNLKKIEQLEHNEITIENNKIPVSKHRIKDFKIKLTSVLGDIIC